ncbi:MAG: hypothetical protein JO131_06340 [Gammaproteobacteria bacterium]|nr:hypothetical protein [Gammaproteobacteria bacterium]
MFRAESGKKNSVSDYKENKEYQDLLSKYAQAKNALKDAVSSLNKLKKAAEVLTSEKDEKNIGYEHKIEESQELKEINDSIRVAEKDLKIINKQASETQHAMYLFIENHNISFPRIEALEERFKKVLEALSVQFPEEKKPPNQVDIINDYINKKSNKNFQLFANTESGEALKNLIDPIKPLFEEIHNIIAEIGLIQSFQEKPLAADDILPVTIQILQNVRNKYPELIAKISPATCEISSLLQQVLAETNPIIIDGKPYNNPYFGTLAYHYAHLLDAWIKSDPVYSANIPDEEREYINKLYLDLALLTEEKRKAIVLLPQNQKFPIENISPLLELQIDTFDNRVEMLKNSCEAHYKKIINAKTIEDTIYRTIALGETIQLFQRKYHWGDSELQTFLKEINFSDLNLITYKNIMFTKAIAKSIPEVTAEMANQQDPTKQARLKALQLGFEFFNASAQMDKTFQNTSMQLSSQARAKNSLFEHKENKEDTQLISKKSARKEPILETQKLDFMKKSLPRQTQKAEAFIKRDLSFSPRRRRLNSWYHRRSPIQKFLICSSVALITLGIIAVAAVFTVGGALVAGGIAAAGAGAASAATAIGASATTAAVVGTATSIAVATTGIGLTTGAAIALSVQMDKALDPLTQGKIGSKIQKNLVEEESKNLVEEKSKTRRKSSSSTHSSPLSTASQINLSLPSETSKSDEIANSTLNSTENSVASQNIEQSTVTSNPLSQYPASPTSISFSSRSTNNSDDENNNTLSEVSHTDDKELNTHTPREILNDTPQAEPENNNLSIGNKPN